MAEKMFYTIGEVATRFGVKESLIRYWETEFDVIKPYRNKKGNRLFTPQDVACFERIYHMVKEQGYTLQGAKEKLKSKPVAEDDAKRQIAAGLRQMKVFLLELKEQC